MIFKVTRGSDMGHLIRYLFNEQSGPESSNEHHDCHAVAGQAGVDVPLGRPLSKDEVADLAGVMNISSDYYGTEISNGHVWHLSLSTKGGTDRDLTDEEWAAVATETVQRLGFAGEGSTPPCAWVAVRHGRSANGNDHLHIAVNLVREGGRAASTHKLFPILGQVCSDMEARYGLTVVEGRQKMAGMPGLSRSEIHKAKRLGKTDPERIELARAVRAAALSSRTEDEFVRRLRDAGVAAKPRYDHSGSHRVTGYSVAREPGPGEDAVFFSGGALAKDLTLPALRKGWEVDEGDPRRAATEWGRYRNPDATSDEILPGQYRRYDWDEASSEWGHGRAGATVGGPETQTWAPNQWNQSATRLGQVVHQLREIPADDRRAWETAAHNAAGLMAAMSARLEPIPGPLAKAADVMARSAQPRNPSAAAVPFVPTGTMRTVAAVMAQAQITDEVAVAWQLMLTEMLRLAQTIQQAHLARDEAQQADRLAGEARAALDQARTDLGSSQRLAELVPALVGAFDDEQEAETDEDAKARKRKRSSAVRPEEYAALAAKKAQPRQDPARGSGR
jgi:hypothetical protein